MTQEEFRERLLSMAEKDYKEFSAKLIPGVQNMLGIRLPVLRKLAKEMAKENWQEYLSWTEFIYFEEVMVQGMILGYAKAPVGELLKEAERFIPRIDNWSVNDSFCNGFHAAKKYPEEVWEFLMKYRDSRKEYEVRVVAVMVMSHFLVPEYINEALTVLGRLYTKEYYASMAVAWAFATAWAKFPEETKAYLGVGDIKNGPGNDMEEGGKRECPLDEETYLRMLQKGIESFRIGDEDKEWMREERKTVRNSLK